MDIKSGDIERIVRQVLENMGSHECKCGKSASSAEVPAKSRVAMLTKTERFELQEYPIPEIGDDDVLV